MIIEDTINDFRRELLNLGYSNTAVNNYPKYAQNILDYTKETLKNNRLPYKTTTNI